MGVKKEVASVPKFLAFVNKSYILYMDARHLHTYQVYLYYIYISCNAYLAYTSYESLSTPWRSNFETLWPWHHKHTWPGRALWPSDRWRNGGAQRQFVVTVRASEVGISSAVMYIVIHIQ